MKIAIHNPTFFLQNQEKNFCGYNYEFLIRYASVFYVTDLRKIGQYKRKLLEHNRGDIKIVSSMKQLNRYADVLISFNGVPYKILYHPPKKFLGMKIYHVMDYVFEASKSNRALLDAKVDYVMGYCNHYKYCNFFKRYYGDYKGKIIEVPFGYGKRFQKKESFDKRINKAIALGSVNPVNNVKGNALKEYQEFFSDEEFTHKLRRMIVVHREEWKECIDEMLPTYPETKNPYYNPVEELNKYTMYINDAGLMNFPPARTYEGIACGCVMVAEKLPIWEELGFQDEKNCILFERGNYSDMLKKIKHYIMHKDELKKIQEGTMILATRYSHEEVAARLFANIMERYQETAKIRLE